MAISTSDIQALAKVVYSKGFDEEAIYKNKPGIESCKKLKGFATARGMEVPLEYGLNSSIAGTAAGAVTALTARKLAVATVPQGALFGYVQLDHEVVRNAENGSGETELIDYVKAQIAGTAEALHEELERLFFKSKTGSIAQCSATTAPTGSTITLDSAADCSLFRAGMIIAASSTDGGALASGTPGYATVVSVDPAVPSITVDGTITTQITSISTSWYLYRLNTAYNNGSGQTLPSGLGGWNPITPSSSFLGVNQTLDPTHLAGTRTTDTSNVETIFIRARALAQALVGTSFREGTIFLNPLQMATLISSKESAKWIDGDKELNFGFKTARMGGYTFTEAPFAPVNYAHMVPRDAMELQTAGEAVWMSDLIYDPATGKYAAGMSVLGNFVCRAPRNLVRIKLPTVSFT